MDCPADLATQAKPKANRTRIENVNDGCIAEFIVNFIKCFAKKLRNCMNLAVMRDFVDARSFNTQGVFTVGTLDELRRLGRRDGVADLDPYDCSSRVRWVDAADEFRL